MAEGRSIYAEDIVRNAQGELGLVLEDGEETNDDSSDSEDEAALKKGQILVCWYPSGNEETLSVTKVTLTKILISLSVNSTCTNTVFT